MASVAAGRSLEVALSMFWDGWVTTLAMDIAIYICIYTYCIIQSQWSAARKNLGNPSVSFWGVLLSPCHRKSKQQSQTRSLSYSLRYSMAKDNIFVCGERINFGVRHHLWTAPLKVLLVCCSSKFMAFSSLNRLLPSKTPNKSEQHNRGRMGQGMAGHGRAIQASSAPVVRLHE